MDSKTVFHAVIVAAWIQIRHNGASNAKSCSLPVRSRHTHLESEPLSRGSLGGVEDDAIAKLG